MSFNRNILLAFGIALVFWGVMIFFSTGCDTAHADPYKNLYEQQVVKYDSLNTIFDSVRVHLDEQEVLINQLGQEALYWAYIADSLQNIPINIQCYNEVAWWLEYTQHWTDSAIVRHNGSLTEYLNYLLQYRK